MRAPRILADAAAWTAAMDATLQRSAVDLIDRMLAVTPYNIQETP